MSKYVYDDETSARRLDAYIHILMDAYGVDLEGLAEIAGVTAEEMREFQAAPYGEKSVRIFKKLALITGVSVSWLCCETPAREKPVYAAVTVEGEGREAVMRFPNMETLMNVINNLPAKTSKGETITAARLVNGEEAAEIGSLSDDGAVG